VLIQVEQGRGTAGKGIRVGGGEAQSGVESGQRLVRLMPGEMVPAAAEQSG